MLLSFFGCLFLKIMLLLIGLLQGSDKLSKLAIIVESWLNSSSRSKSLFELSDLTSKLSDSEQSSDSEFGLDSRTNSSCASGFVNWSVDECSVKLFVCIPLSV